MVEIVARLSMGSPTRPWFCPLAGLVPALLVLVGGLPVAAQDPASHHHHHHGGGVVPAAASAPSPGAPSANHGAHGHDLGPAGDTYDLRFIDGMVQHHTGALRMGEFVFDIGAPGVGALAASIWNDQAQEIKAMGQWRKAWYPEAPVYPVAYRPGGDPNSIAGLQPMTAAQMASMRMLNTLPTKANRVTWFLEGMLQHHGGALVMAHDALRKSRNPTILRLARSIISAQRHEILRLRQMLQHDGLTKPEYFYYDRLFSFP
jgi:uncharacterized protein (DUF305 family)